MKIAAHQPYFFPYIGYFSLISAVDQFVFFDISQFTRQSWMTRNRILSPTLDNFLYINIDIEKPPYKALQTQCYLSPDTKWKSRLFAQLQHFKKKAPFYDETIVLLQQLLSGEYQTLVEFNVQSTIGIARSLGITTAFERASAIEPQITQYDEKNWGLNITRALDGDTYINAPGGEALYPKNLFQKAGIGLGFIQHKLSPYPQGNNTFIPSLSIIDVLLFNGLKRTSKMLHDYSIKWMVK